jgi:ankyrin repeat protein
LRYGERDIHSSELRQLLSRDDEAHDLLLSPLHHIVTDLSDLPLEKKFEFAAGSIDVVDWLGRSPLMWACLRGDYPKVSQLLAEGADIHLQDLEQRTPLHYASRSGCILCIKSLINAGADPNVVDINGSSPLHGIVFSDHMSDDLDESVEVLFEAGVDVDKRNNMGSRRCSSLPTKVWQTEFLCC